MFAPAPWFDAWISRTALAGGMLLLLGLLGMLLFRQPARRQRLGELALLGSILVAVLAALPAWWSVPAQAIPTSTPVEPTESPPADRVEEPAVSPIIVGMLDASEVDWVSRDEAPPIPASALEPSPMPAARRIPWLTIVGMVYAAFMLILLVRCTFGYFALWRLARNAGPAPARVRKLLAELTPAGQPAPRLAVAERLKSPVSFGLRQPTILLPANFCHPGQDLALASVLVHELTHLQRHDAWSCLLLAISQSVYFYQPWFWWLKKQVRLAQEFIADAAAARVLPAVDYAQYLVHLSAQANPGSFAASRANGVFQSPSDLARRVEMLLNPSAPLERFVPRGWSLLAAGIFIGAGTLMSGVQLYAEEKPAPSADGSARVLEVLAESNQESKVSRDQGGAVDLDLTLTLTQVGDETGPARVRLVTTQETEQLAKLQKALDALKTAAKKLGDDVPEEVRQQLIEVERQLAEASIRARAVAPRVSIDGRINAESQRFRELQQQAEAEAARLRAVAAAEFARLRADADTLATDVKRRLNQLANTEMDENKRLAELEALRALMIKSKELNNRIAQAEKHAEAAAAQAKLKEDRKGAAGEQNPLAASVKPLVPPRPPAPAPRSFVFHAPVVHRLGVRLEPVPPVLADQMKLDANKGLVIIEVRPDSPAADKLRKFDVLLEVDGKAVKTDAIGFAREVDKLKAEEPIKIRVLRGGKIILLEDVKLSEGKAAPEITWVDIGPEGKLGQMQNYFFQPMADPEKLEPLVRSYMMFQNDKRDQTSKPKEEKAAEKAKGASSKASQPALPSADPATQKKNVSLMISRDDKQLLIRQQEGEETIVIRARLEAGISVIDRIEINEDGKKVKTFKSIAEVDAPLRDKIRKLLEAANQTEPRAGDGSL